MRGKESDEKNWGDGCPKKAGKGICDEYYKA